MNNLLQKQIKLNCILGLSAFMGCGLLYNKDKILDYLYSHKKLVIYNNWAFMMKY